MKSTHTRSTSHDIKGDRAYVNSCVWQGPHHERLKLTNGYCDCILMNNQIQIYIVSGTNNHLKGWRSQTKKIEGKSL